jgi:hypothetical protein
MRSKYYLADRLPGYLINLSLLNDRYWAASRHRLPMPVPPRMEALLINGMKV